MVVGVGVRVDAGVFSGVEVGVELVGWAVGSGLKDDSGEGDGVVGDGGVGDEVWLGGRVGVGEGD